MALYIRDNDVDALAAKLQAISKAPSKTAAVRAALEHEIQRYSERVPLSQRLGKARALVAEMGIVKGDGEAFDMKAFTDEGWGKP